VLEIEPRTRLVISFSALYDPLVRQDHPSRLSSEIRQMDEVCKLTVTHDGFDTGSQTARDVAACMPTILSNLKTLLETGRRRIFKEIVFDCDSPRTLADFWAAVTGYQRVADADTYVAIADPRGVEPELAFVQVPEPKTVKNRLHLDVNLEDFTAEVERLLSLGATRAPGYPQNDGHAVLRDPEGNEFCVLG
ncbi:MAG: SRPBCC domain-containing protein, partial [Chloroflexota bacterium]|nr:SRPBCC domain-containing protein [Chloroflexota bacterium]